jgi:hypothetical protein
MWAFGSADAWRASREKANKNPLVGDGGVDLVVDGKNVDAKASQLLPSRDPLRYRLAVRPRERHAGVVYILALHPHGLWNMLLVGFAEEPELGDKPETEGVFSGAFTIPATRLHPLRRPL